MKRILYVSSGEVYGSGDVDEKGFLESYSRYMDPMQVRSCYPMGKCAAEAFCAAYAAQKDVDVVVVCPCHVYGLCITEADDHASSQFLFYTGYGTDIVLNSEDLQKRSYCHVVNCVSAMLTLLTSGKKLKRTTYPILIPLFRLRVLQPWLHKRVAADLSVSCPVLLN